MELNEIIAGILGIVALALLIAGGIAENKKAETSIELKHYERWLSSVKGYAIAAILLGLAFFVKYNF